MIPHWDIQEKEQWAFFQLKSSGEALLRRDQIAAVVSNPTGGAQVWLLNGQCLEIVPDVKQVLIGLKIKADS